MRTPRFRPARLVPLAQLAPALLGFAGVVLVPSIALVGCGPPSPAPSSGSHTVSFTAAGGVELQGRLFEAEGATAGIVLAHMRPADQSSWFDYAGTLADDGYETLTFNFRGYCPGGDAGCSSGQTDPPLLWRDVEAAVRFLRSEGVARVGVIGASIGGTAALVAAAQPSARIVAIAALSAPISIERLTASPETLVAATSAKLFVAGNADATAAADAQSLYDLSVPPKRVEIVPSSDHGTDLLEGNQGPNVRQILQSWLARFLPLQAVSDEG